MLKINKKLVFIPIIFCFMLSSTVSAAIGDTQGKVKSIALHPVNQGIHKLSIYFTGIENDRWNCVSTNGYVQVTDSILVYQLTN